MIRFSIILISAILALSTFGQRTNTTRRISKVKTTESSETVAQYTIECDTIVCHQDELSFSGYEKTLRSNWESVFATNHTNDTIQQISITIDYYDIEDRQLHQRLETVNAIIPPSETRQVQFKTWDKNKVWYYYLSEPTRTKSQATPYKVKISPLSINVRRKL